MDLLTKRLFEESKDLKTKYLQMTYDWAQENFERYVKIANWSEEQWCKYFRIEPRIANRGTPNEYVTFPSNFFNTSDSRKYSNMRDTAKNIEYKGRAAYVDKEMKNALRHYEDSIIKLSSKIKQKGLDTDNIRLSSSSMGVNFETVITDGIKKVRAFTIIASGQIQRPHYRYLIK